MSQAAKTAAAPKRPLWRRLMLFGLIALAAVVVVVVIFYVEENSRGKSVWAASKSSLESQQEVLDWSAYIPPPLPDEQNFFKAPKMQDWFTGKGSNELTRLLSLNSFAELANTNPPTLLAEWILRSDDGSGTSQADAPAPKLDTFKFDRTPLGNALQQLAAAAHLKVQIDPHVDAAAASAVTAGWTNVSAQAALLSLVCNNNLHWADDTNTGGGFIKAPDLNAPLTGADSVGIVLGMLRQTVAPSGDAAEGFALGADPFRERGPMKLSVSADSIPAKAQMLRLFAGAGSLRVEPAGNTLEVSMAPAPIAAADYLKWSDQFTPQFAVLREAVKRPGSRLEGDYEHFNEMPAIDFSAVEGAARVLADRARCYLILNQPDQALSELTLYNDFLVCLARPGARPVSLLTASSFVLFRALYDETISFGLRAGSWGEPELTALQAQLSHIDLLSLVWNAMESDRAWRCRYFETASRPDLDQALQLGGASATFSEKLRNHKYLVFTFMPRGWIDQNIARLAPLRQADIDSIDRTLGIIRPHLVESARQKALAAFHNASPFSMLAKLATPPLDTTLNGAARVQVLVNQTLVVCALERFRLAHGLYPEKLDVLAPDFIPVLPVDPINGGALQYHHIAGGRFLLYSVGWDEKDDGGTPADAKGNGDWVWGVR